MCGLRTSVPLLRHQVQSGFELVRLFDVDFLHNVPDCLPDCQLAHGFRLLPPWTSLYLWTRALTQHQVVMVGHVAQAVQGPAHVDVGGRVILVKIVVRRSFLV